MKADLDRAVGLQPVKDWERRSLKSHVLGCCRWQEVQFHNKTGASNPFPEEFIVQRLRDAAGRHVLKEGSVL